MRWTLLASALLWVGCWRAPRIDYKGLPAAGCTEDETRGTGFAQSEHLPLPAPELEQRLRGGEFHVVRGKTASRGMTGVAKLTLQFPDCTIVKAKWKPEPKSGDTYNNSPRKEVAAYHFQKLFLDPVDYVVPVTLETCIPVSTLKQIGSSSEPQIKNTHCVLGVLSVWLDEVKVEDAYPHKKRFRRSVEAARAGSSGDDYAHHFGNFNIFTYLIHHKDGRGGNFLRSAHPGSTRVFSIDNGLAFSGKGNPNPLIPKLQKLQVKDLPKVTVDKLRNLDQATLRRKLQTVNELHFTGDGKHRHPEEYSLLGDAKRGVRRAKGRQQIGLTRNEIQSIETRLKKLLARVDRGEIRLF